MMKIIVHTWIQIIELFNEIVDIVDWNVLQNDIKQSPNIVRLIGIMSSNVYAKSSQYGW